MTQKNPESVDAIIAKWLLLLLALAMLAGLVDWLAIPGGVL